MNTYTPEAFYEKDYEAYLEYWKDEGYKGTEDFIMSFAEYIAEQEQAEIVHFDDVRDYYSSII